MTDHIDEINNESFQSAWNSDILQTKEIWDDDEVKIELNDEQNNALPSDFVTNESNELSKFKDENTFEVDFPIQQQPPLQHQKEEQQNVAIKSDEISELASRILEIVQLKLVTEIEVGISIPGFDDDDNTNMDEVHGNKVDTLIYCSYYKYLSDAIYKILTHTLSLSLSPPPPPHKLEFITRWWFQYFEYFKRD